MAAGLRNWTARWATARACRSLPGSGPRPRLGRCLSADQDHRIFEARLGERAAVVRHDLAPGHAQRLRTMGAALTAAHPRMIRGNDRLPELLGLAPEAGIMVTERATGTPLAEVLHDGAKPRATLITRAGAWLARYIEGSRVEDAFGGGFWIKLRRKAMAGMPTGPDRDLMGGLIEVLIRERARIGTRPITRAQSHGDFTPRRLLVDGDTLWGLDPSEMHWIALCKDLARFLVWLEVHTPAGGTPGLAGLDPADVSALLRPGGLLPPEEYEIVLPYFVAVEISGLLASDPAPSKSDRVRALARRLCNGSDQTAGL